MYGRDVELILFFQKRQQHLQNASQTELRPFSFFQLQGSVLYLPSQRGNTKASNMNRKAIDGHELQKKLISSDSSNLLKETLQKLISKNFKPHPREITFTGWKPPITSAMSSIRVKKKFHFQWKYLSMFSHLLMLRGTCKEKVESVNRYVCRNDRNSRSLVDCIRFNKWVPFPSLVQNRKLAFLHSLAMVLTYFPFSLLGLYPVLADPRLESHALLEPCGNQDHHINHTMRNKLVLSIFCILEHHVVVETNQKGFSKTLTGPTNLLTNNVICLCALWLTHGRTQLSFKHN